MYCPRCRGEYREGFHRCSECDMELVGELPLEPEPEFMDMATIFEGNSSGAAVTSATLGSAGIESWIRDEGIQGVFPSLGPAEVQVRVKDEKWALKALGTAVENEESLGEEGV